MAGLPPAIRNGFLALLRAPMDALVRRRVHPNTITTLGFLITVSAGVAYFTGHIRLGGTLVILGGIADIFDGYVARGTGLASRFGSFYDSTLDRISEILVFTGVLSLYGGPGPTFGPEWNWMVYTVMLAMAGSLMVSYTRARSEGLGIECKVGLMQRPERIVLLGVSTMFFGDMWNGAVLTGVLLLMALLTNFTTFQRIVWVYRHTRPTPAEPPAAERHASVTASEEPR